MGRYTTPTYIVDEDNDGVVPYIVSLTPEETLGLVGRETRSEGAEIHGIANPAEECQPMITHQGA